MLTISETTELRQTTSIFVDDTGEMSLTVEGQPGPNGTRRAIVVPMTLAEVSRLQVSLSIAIQTMRRAGVE